MTTTIFLQDAATLRISFPYSQTAVDAMKTVEGATFDKASRTWRRRRPVPHATSSSVTLR